MTSRLRWVALGTVLLFTVYSGVWWSLGKHLSSRIDEAAHRLHAHGYQIAYKSMRVKGFPFHLKAVMSEPRLTVEGKVQTWVDGTLVLRAALWNHRRVGFQFKGPHHVVINDPFASLGGFVGWEGCGECNLQEIQVISLHYGKARVEAFGYAPLVEAQDIDWHVERILQDDKQPPRLFISSLKIGALTGQILKNNIIGESLQSIDLKVDFSGTPAGLTLKEKLHTWYQTGGVLDITKLAFQWGEMSLQSEGTISLDNDLQPMAAFSIDHEGIDSLLHALVAADIIKQKHIKGIKTAIALLFNPNSNPRIGITLQDSALSIGPVTVLRIPRIQWPAIPPEKAPAVRNHKNQATGEKLQLPKPGAV
jgi:hypothetical protein